MIRNLSRNRQLWMLAAFMSLAAASAGVVYPEMYEAVVSEDMMPGVMSQDLVAMVLSIAVFPLVFRMREEHTMRQVAVLGILGYFFYGYGMYAIEQVYTVLYFLYLALFGMSAYLIVYFLVSLPREALTRVTAPGPVRAVSVAFLLMIAVMFVALWTSQIIPLIEDGEKKEFTFSIYILDLCFIMPALVMAAVMSARKQGLGILMTPALFVIGSTVLASPGLGEVLKPLFYNMDADTGQAALFLVLSAVFMLLAVVNLRTIRVDRVGTGSDVDTLK